MGLRPLLESLKKDRQFREVYHKGKSFADKFLVMYVLENGLGRNRIGISVSKRVGNSVARHRLARLIRESFRLEEAAFMKGFDIVVIVRVAAKGRGLGEIKNAVLHLGRRHRIISEMVNS